MQTPVESNCWQTEDAEFVVVRDGLKQLIGRDQFEALGISLTQTLHFVERSMINTIITQCAFETRIANQFPQYFSRICRSKVYIINSKFHKRFQPNLQKGRRVPINLQDRVNTENKKLLQEGHMEKLKIYSDQHYISTIVMTVKRDQTKN